MSNWEDFEHGVLRSKDLAEITGTTIRAIRHYLQLGLLEEPPRDSNGYRRFNAAHVVQVLRIKMLAESGSVATNWASLITAMFCGRSATVPVVNSAGSCRAEVAGSSVSGVEIAWRSEIEMSPLYFSADRVSIIRIRSRVSGWESPSGTVKRTFCHPSKVMWSPSMFVTVPSGVLTCSLGQAPVPSPRTIISNATVLPSSFTGSFGMR
ncbi:MAG TPA: MerR family transcriptional regulator [Brevibacterium epidermidis]|uniref:MerR family transcriptional regulator n=1 Tax=Brevibacterium epidermidis TaxID=1698 RepID=A0A9D2ZWU9_BREEP|nr:MerR family transcriptional regulator [Brevibacterium epidermidis]